MPVQTLIQAFVLIGIYTIHSPSVVKRTEPASQPSEMGTFVGTSLCAGIARPLLEIPPQDSCHHIKWKLTFYRQTASQERAKYKLIREYGFYIDNRTYESKGTHVVEGMWTIGRGTRSDPDAIVYQLDSEKPQRMLAFVKLDENLIHLLDRDKNLMVGNAAQSFTLSRLRESR